MAVFSGVAYTLLLFFFVLQCPCSNQIRVLAFICTSVDTSFISTKKSNLAKQFFDICNAEMAQSLSSLQKSEFTKLIILIFYVKKLNNKCELDVRVIACNFQVFGIFSFFSDFFRSNSFIVEPKVEKIYGCFFQSFCATDLNFGKKIMEE